MTETSAKRTIQIGDTAVEIVEPIPVETTVVEAIVESRVWHGVLCLSTASLANYGGNGSPEARVNCRLRIPLSILPVIRQIIDDTLAPSSAPPKDQLQ